MTVAELLKALEGMDPSAEVLVVHDEKVFSVDGATIDDGQRYSADDGFDPKGGPQPFVAINTFF